MPLRFVGPEGGVIGVDMNDDQLEFADRKVPEEINTHPLLLGECLGGAMCGEEFDAVMKANGWDGYEVVSSAESPIENAEIEELIGDIRYYSKTIRAVRGEESCCCRMAVPFGNCAVYTVRNENGQYSIPEEMKIKE